MIKIEKLRVKAMIDVKKLLLFSSMMFFVFGGKSALQGAGPVSDCYSGRKKSQEMICFERAQRMALFTKKQLEYLYDTDPEKGFNCAMHVICQFKNWRDDYDQVSFWLGANVIRDLLVQWMKAVQILDDQSNEALIKEYNLILRKRDSKLESMLTRPKVNFYRELCQRYPATIKTISVVESFYGHLLSINEKVDD